MIFERNQECVLDNTPYDEIDHEVGIFSSFIEDIFSNLDNNLVSLERKDFDQHTQVKEAVMVEGTVDKKETCIENPKITISRGCLIKYLFKMEAKHKIDGEEQ